METVAISPERKAQLEAFAKEQGQEPAEALDDALAAWLESHQDFEEAIQGVRRGLEDVKAGRTRPAAEFFFETRRKYGFPG